MVPIMTDPPFCSLDPDALTRRKAAWADLDAAVVARRPTATGAEIVYRLEPGLGDRLLALVAAEAACCPSLTLEPTVALAIHAPGGAGTVPVWEGAVGG